MVNVSRHMNIGRYDLEIIECRKWHISDSKNTSQTHSNALYTEFMLYSFCKMVFLRSLRNVDQHPKQTYIFYGICPVQNKATKKCMVNLWFVEFIRSREITVSPVCINRTTEFINTLFIRAEKKRSTAFKWEWCTLRLNRFWLKDCVCLYVAISLAFASTH